MLHLHPLVRERWLTVLLVAALTLSSCARIPTAPTQEPTLSAPTPVDSSYQPTPVPTRPVYKPGQLVNYIAQTGDTVPALAARFNTTVDEIMVANPIIPKDATTMPPGLPMKIPIYYRALWYSPFQILPDNAFVNGPALIGFNTSAFVAAHDGWLKNYRAYAGDAWRSGAEIVDYVATNFSISPRLLLAIMEYQAGALSQPAPPKTKYILGYQQLYYESVYLQLVGVANTLNNGYYGWRAGNLLEFDLPDTKIVRPDPWENAGSVALLYFFSKIYSGDSYALATGPKGFIATYTKLFGDPWKDNTVLIPGSLHQPDLTFPFPPGQTWSFTGGPHTGFGKGLPLSAVDFAPPSEHHGCFAPDPQNYAVSMADGLVVRSGPDGLVLDLDGDGDERTGWVIYYLHLNVNGRAAAGQTLHTGDMIGYPSCQGGEATGTHVHIARKYNGEWILADGVLPFNLEGWITHNGPVAYQGTLTRGGVTVTACQCSDAASSIRSDSP